MRRHGGWEFIAWTANYWRNEILRIQQAAFDASVEEGEDPLVWSERMRPEAWRPHRQTVIDRNDFVRCVVRNSFYPIPLASID